MSLTPRSPVALEQKLGWRLRQRVEIVAGKAEISTTGSNRATHWSVPLEDLMPYHDEVRTPPGAWLSFSLLGLTLGLMILFVAVFSVSAHVRNDDIWVAVLAILTPPVILCWPSVRLYRRLSRTNMIFYSQSTGQPVLGLRADGPDREEAASFRDALLAES